MDALFLTGYPHAINLFAALLLTLLPSLSPLAEGGIPALRNGLAGIISLLYLAGWSRIRVFHADRPPRFFWLYITAQTVVVSLIYALDGGLTRFLFVVVAVQAVYVSPVRRWAPYLGTLAALWLSLYLAFSPDPRQNMVATIGLYLSYLLFAAFVTFTAVQQERQNRVAQELLEGVNRQHHTLRAYEQRVGHRAEGEERERLARTICTTLLSRLTTLMEELYQGLAGGAPDRATSRAARLHAKDVLAEIRQVVRTLRPEAEAELVEEDEPEPGQFRYSPPPEPTIPYRWTDPIRVYHVWNVLVTGLVLGVIVASALVERSPRWWLLLTAGACLLLAYGASAWFRQPWNRTLALIVQCGLIVWMVVLSEEPLMNHLFLIVAAQMVFAVPPVTRWLVGAVTFPTLLSGAALALTTEFASDLPLLLTLTAAFGVTNFFGAVMAFMTRRQVEDRQRAVLYTEQLAEVNRKLEARVYELQRMAVARERVRMAREIHDGLGHHLTIVIMELQYAEQLADEDADATRQHVAQAVQVIDAAMASARELVENLDRFERPLAEAIFDMVQAWRKGNGVTVSLRVGGDFAELTTAARVTLYRAVQESLTNIQKHTRASHVDIELLQLPDRVILHVMNDDRGGAPRFEAMRSGFGLLGLKERADALQGEFTAGSRPQGGFQVRMVLPFGGLNNE